MFLVCAAYLVGSYLIKPELQPDWVRDAYLIEPDPGGRAIGSRPAARSLPAGPVPRPRPTSRRAGQGYTDAQRQALDKLVSPQP